MLYLQIKSMDPSTHLKGYYDPSTFSYVAGVLMSFYQLDIFFFNQMTGGKGGLNISNNHIVLTIR